MNSNIVWLSNFYSTQNDFDDLIEGSVGFKYPTFFFFNFYYQIAAKLMKITAALAYSSLVLIRE